MSENSVEYRKRRGYKQKMKLNTKQTIKIGFAFLSICAFWQMYNSVIPLILTNTFHMNEKMCIRDSRQGETGAGEVKQQGSNIVSYKQNL